MRNTRHQPDQNTPSEFEEKVIQISRVSKKTKGGNHMGFSILVVVGDRKGKVGLAVGKAADVLSAIKKGTKKAKKKMISVPLNGTTIPFAVTAKFGAGRVMLKPAPRGSGVIAGGAVRAVVEAAGVRDISSKILGSQNKASSVYATFAGLKEIARLVQHKHISVRSIAQVEAAEAQKEAEAQAKAQLHAETKEVALREKTAAQKPASLKAKPAAKPKSIKKKA